MFFEFVPHKVFKIILLTCVLGLGSFAAFVIDGRYYVIDRSLIALENIKSSMFYLPHQLAAVSAFNSSLRFSEAKSVPVLLYHGIPKSEDKSNLERSFSISFPNFVDQMKSLKENGWQTVSLEDFQEFMAGKKDLPDKSFLLTFDDGIKSSFYNTDPVLKDLGWNAVMFVSTSGSLGKEESSTYYLSRQELIHMVDTGRWQIESHGERATHWLYIDSEGTQGHFLSNKAWFTSEGRAESDTEFILRIKKDLENSKDVIEGNLGTEVSAFAYPFGDFGQESNNFDGGQDIISDVVSSIYDISFYQTWSGIAETFNYPNLAPGFFTARRIEPAPDWTSQILLSILEEGRAKALPYNEENFGEEWTATWGSITRGESLILEALPETTGASALLLGSHWWEDYIFSARVSWGEDSHVSLIARGIDNDNYIACTFSDSKVYLKEKLAGKLETVSDAEVSLGNTESVIIGIDTNGSTAKCLMDDVVVVEKFSFDNNFKSGSIGVQVWNKEVGKATAAIYEVSIQ